MTTLSEVMGLFSFLIKFGYSEKATKFEKIFHVKFDVTSALWIYERSIYLAHENQYRIDEFWVFLYQIVFDKRKQ